MPKSVEFDRELFTFRRSDIVVIFRQWKAETKVGQWPDDLSAEKSADTFLEYAEAKWPERFGK